MSTPIERRTEKAKAEGWTDIRYSTGGMGGLIGTTPQGGIGWPVPEYPECCYCAGPHSADNCPFVFTPIADCEHKDSVDGCCSHPKNMTPECHVGACPRLHANIYKAWAEKVPPSKST